MDVAPDETILLPGLLEAASYAAKQGLDWADAFPKAVRRLARGVKVTDQKITFEDVEYMDVLEFHTKMGQLVNHDPGRLTKGLVMERIRFLQEELKELEEAADKNDLAEMADALVDLVYVAKGTAVMMGLPWRELWDDVQRANMAKEPGFTHRGYLHDVKKPEGWQPPQTETILKAAGWDGTNPQVGRDYPCFLTPREGA